MGFGVSDFSPQEDAVTAYDAAEERARILRKHWEDEGMPLYTEGSTGQLVPHPIIKMIHDAELLADRLRKNVQSKHAGPNAKAVATAKIGKSPAQKLRAVK